MRTLLPDPPPPELQQPLEELLERRRRWNADIHDEVWDGVLHMNPVPHGRHGRLQAQLLVLLDPLARARGLTPTAEFNVGESDDYRIPDAGLHRPGPDQLFYPTAALVVEVLSPRDETPQKLPFYAAHGVDELLIVDPEERTVRWLSLGADGDYHQVERSALIDLAAADLAARLRWPA